MVISDRDENKGIVDDVLKAPVESFDKVDSTFAEGAGEGDFFFLRKGNPLL